MRELKIKRVISETVDQEAADKAIRRHMWKMGEVPSVLEAERPTFPSSQTNLDTYMTPEYHNACGLIIGYETETRSFIVQEIKHPLATPTEISLIKVRFLGYPANECGGPFIPMECAGFELITCPVPIFE